MLIYSDGCTTCNATTFLNTSASSTSSLIGTSFTPTSYIPACGTSGYYCVSCPHVSGVQACGFTDVYGSGTSVSGYVLSDQVSIGVIPGVTASFGAITTVVNPPSVPTFQPVRENPLHTKCGEKD